MRKTDRIKKPVHFRRQALIIRWFLLFSIFNFFCILSDINDHFIFIIIISSGFLKFLHSLSHTTHQFRDFTASKKQQYQQNNNNDLPDSYCKGYKRFHF